MKVRLTSKRPTWSPIEKHLGHRVFLKVKSRILRKVIHVWYSYPTDRTVLLSTVIYSEYNHHKHPQVLVPMTVCTAPPRKWRLQNAKLEMFISLRVHTPARSGYDPSQRMNNHLWNLFQARLHTVVFRQNNEYIRPIFEGTEGSRLTSLLPTQQRNSPDNYCEYFKRCYSEI